MLDIENIVLWSLYFFGEFRINKQFKDNYKFVNCKKYDEGRGQGVMGKK